MAPDFDTLICPADVRPVDWYFVRFEMDRSLLRMFPALIALPETCAAGGFLSVVDDQPGA